MVHDVTGAAYAVTYMYQGNPYMRNTRYFDNYTDAKEYYDKITSYRGYQATLKQLD